MADHTKRMWDKRGCKWSIVIRKTIKTDVQGRDISKSITVEPRFNEPLYNEVLDITNDFFQPGQNYSKMYGTEPRKTKSLL